MFGTFASLRWFDYLCIAGVWWVCLAGGGTGGVVFVVLCGLVGFCLCDVVDVFVLCCWSCFRQVWLAVVYFCVEFSVLVCVKCSIRDLVVC